MKTILLMLLFPALAMAQELTVKNVNGKKTRFSATFTEAPDVGQAFDRVGSCPARVTAIKGSSAILTVSKCPDLAKGDVFGPTPITESRAPVQSKSGHKFGGGVVYSMADSVEYGLKLNTGNFTAKDSTDSAFGFVGNYHYIRDWKVGFTGSVTYELAREFTSTTINGATFGYTTAPSLTLLTIALNANFAAFDGAYVYGGINYPVLTDFSSQAASLEADIGYQFGGGYFIRKDIGVDVQMRFLRVKGSYNSGLEAGSIENAKMDGFIFGASYYYR